MGASCKKPKKNPKSQKRRAAEEIPFRGKIFSSGTHFDMDAVLSKKPIPNNVTSPNATKNREIIGFVYEEDKGVVDRKITAKNSGITPTESQPVKIPLELQNNDRSQTGDLTKLQSLKPSYNNNSSNVNDTSASDKNDKLLELEKQIKDLIKKQEQLKSRDDEINLRGEQLQAKILEHDSILAKSTLPGETNDNETLNDFKMKMEQRMEEIHNQIMNEFERQSKNSDKRIQELQDERDRQKKEIEDLLKEIEKLKDNSGIDKVRNNKNTRQNSTGLHPHSQTLGSKKISKILEAEPIMSPREKYRCLTSNKRLIDDDDCQQQSSSLDVLLSRTCGCYVHEKHTPKTCKICKEVDFSDIPLIQ